MILHHFTDYWPEIDASDVIRTGWPPHNNLTFGLRDRRYRVTVDIPVGDAHSWLVWAPLHLRPEEVGTLTRPTRGAIPHADETPARPDEWYVTERPVPRVEWLWVADLRTGAIMWRAE